MFKLIKPLSILISFGALSACALAPHSAGDERAKFGEANHANIKAHAVAPNPDLKANTYIPADRDRMQAARDAYRNGQVKSPEYTN